MGAEYLFYMKSIETHARAFLALIILPIGTVMAIEKKQILGAVLELPCDSANLVNILGKWAGLALLSSW